MSFHTQQVSKKQILHIRSTTARLSDALDSWLIGARYNYCTSNKSYLYSHVMKFASTLLLVMFNYSVSLKTISSGTFNNIRTGMQGSWSCRSLSLQDSNLIHDQIPNNKAMNYTMGILFWSSRLKIFLFWPNLLHTLRGLKALSC